MEFRLRLEGNNGGDFIEIRSWDEGRIMLEVGHCCVKVVDRIVPIEFLTYVVAKAVMDWGEGDDKIKSIMSQANWPAAYVEELIEKIE